MRLWPYRSNEADYRDWPQLSGVGALDNRAPTPIAQIMRRRRLLPPGRHTRSDRGSSQCDIADDSGEAARRSREQ
jgi:hypothetical protein